MYCLSRILTLPEIIHGSLTAQVMIVEAYRRFLAAPCSCAACERLKFEIERVCGRG